MPDTNQPAFAGRRTCPTCNYASRRLTIGEGSAPAEQGSPRAGDFLVCHCCGEILYFAENGSLLAATATEFSKLMDTQTHMAFNMHRVASEIRACNSLSSDLHD